MVLLPKYYLLDGKLEAYQTGLGQEQLLLDWLPGVLELRWRGSGTRIPFYEDQYARFLKFAAGLSADPGWIPEAEALQAQLIRLIQGNRLYKGVEIRFYLRPGDQRNNHPNLLIISIPHPEEQFALNATGWIIGACPGKIIPNRDEFLHWRFHSIRKQGWEQLAVESEVDCVYFMNPERHLLDTPNGMLYLIKGKKVFTPLSEQYIQKRAIAASIKKCCTQLGLQFAATSALLPEHLNQAEEVFLADDYDGIRWVMGHQEKRYFKKMSPKIADLLNAEWAG